MLIELLRSNLSGGEKIMHAIMMFVAITLTFSFHEFMHAVAAVWLGDDTPKRMGRYTMNPLVHTDPMGTFLILLIGFGWGRPVVYNPAALRRFKNIRLMNILVAFAGPFGNFLMALTGTIVAAIIECCAGAEFNSIVYVIYGIMVYLVSFSLGLMAFNLIPLNPLDGFKILDEFMPLRIKYNSSGYKKFVALGPQILLILIVVGRLGGIDVLGTIMGIISMPASLLLSLVSRLIYTIFGAI